MGSLRRRDQPRTRVLPLGVQALGRAADRGRLELPVDHPVVLHPGLVDRPRRCHPDPARRHPHRRNRRAGPTTRHAPTRRQRGTDVRVRRLRPDRDRSRPRRHQRPNPVPHPRRPRLPRQRSTTPEPAHRHRRPAATPRATHVLRRPGPLALTDRDAHRTRPPLHLHPTTPRPPHHGRPPAPLGTPTHHQPGHPTPRPKRVSSTCRHARHARQPATTFTSQLRTNQRHPKTTQNPRPPRTVR